MRILTTQEARDWCWARGLKMTDGRYLRYEPWNASCVTISLEDKPSRVIALADHLVPTWEDVPFRGALLWVRERGIWGDFSEKAAELMVRQMRLGSGETQTLDMKPAQLFEPDELFSMHSYFLIPMLFGWDAFLIPLDEDYYFFVSHDGFLVIVGRADGALEQIRQRVREWNPQKDEGWYHGVARG